MDHPSAPEVASAPTVPVCQLTTVNGPYNGELVRVRGRWHGALESSSFKDPDCETSLVWVDFDRARMDRLSPAAVLSSFEKLEVNRSGYPSAANALLDLDVVFVGLLDGPRPGHIGYGHEGFGRSRLTVYAVERAEPSKSNELSN